MPDPVPDEVASRPHDVHSFVLRARLDPLPGPLPRNALRIRLEHVNAREVWHFDNIGRVLDQLRRSLEAVVESDLT